MKKIIAFSLIFSQQIFASDLLTQLTTSEYDGSHAEKYNGETELKKATVVPLQNSACETLKFMNEQIPDPITSDFIKERIKISNQCYQNISINSKNEIVSFRLENNSNNQINPRTISILSARSFDFVIPERSIQNTHLKITDDSGLTQKLSHDLLETSIHFFPRVQLPTLESLEVENKIYKKVTLATGEEVIFDALTNEIVSGVITESKMDLNPSRHDRKFAQLQYTGKGVTIRADRRSGSPELVYSSAFNKNEKIKDATIQYKNQTCYVSKNLIWENASSESANAYFKYATDEEFVEKILNQKCGWKINLQDLL